MAVPCREDHDALGPQIGVMRYKLSEKRVFDALRSSMRMRTDGDKLDGCEIDNGQRKQFAASVLRFAESPLGPD